jgi:hypothetical protein
LKEYPLFIRKNENEWVGCVRGYAAVIPDAIARKLDEKGYQDGIVVAPDNVLGDILKAADSLDEFYK